MRATWRMTMQKKVSGRFSFWNGSHRGFHAVVMSVLFSLLLTVPALAQQTVTGTVTSTGGAPLQGVTVRVQGTDVRAVTDASGKYRVTAPADAVLTLSYVGKRPETDRRKRSPASGCGRTRSDRRFQWLAWLTQHCPNSRH